MMTCQVCGKQTKKGVPTGRFETLGYKAYSVDDEDGNTSMIAKGTEIVKSKSVCMECCGSEKL